MTLDEIKQIPMCEIVERYGLRPNRAGFIKCPFHQGDKGASLKIYQKDWHCFGCGAGKSQIDFVMKIDGLTFKEAFLSLGGTYAQTREEKEEEKRKIRLAEEARRKRAEAEAETNKRKEENNRNITFYRKSLETFAPYSDEWCFCQKRLQEELAEQEELNDYKKKRGGECGSA